MGEKVSILLVGISGYGNMYLRELFSDNNETAFIKGVVDINPKRSDFYEQLQQKNIPIYESIEAFYQESSADLAIISTPIHLHKHQSCYAMEHGSHVLCEKPMTANPEHIKAMTETRDRTDKFLAIGFNWSFTDSVQQLKSDILAGHYGKPKRLKSLVLWPRNLDYYKRSAWAGKKYSPQGDMIFDSVVNNATAHFLHHLFYLTGASIEESASLKHLTAELYRTNAIETFDTCALSIKTQDDVDIFYYASHAVTEERHPQFELEFEQATIVYNPGSGTADVTAHFADGTKKIYKNPEKGHITKLYVCIEAIRQGHKDILCGPEAASAHVTSVHAMHQSVPNIPSFPDNLTTFDPEKKLLSIEGLSTTLETCYEKWCLPHDLGVEWSKVGEKIELS